jgi:hypothetical protein
MANERFKGKYCYFLERIDGSGYYDRTVLGTCNADNHWSALDKFRDDGRLEPGKRYHVYRDAGRDGHISCIRFVC